jgi:hypothetical protein
MKLYTSTAFIFLAFFFLPAYAFAESVPVHRLVKEWQQEAKIQLNLDLDGYDAISPRQLQQLKESPLSKTEAESLLELITWQCPQISCTGEMMIFLKDADGYIIHRQQNGRLTASPIGKVEGEWMLKHTSSIL